MIENKIKLKWSTKGESKFINTFELSDFHNLFIDHYNNSEQKITAVTEIGANRDEISVQIKEAMKSVDNLYRDLKEIRENPTHSSNSNEHHYSRYSNLAMERVLRRFNELIRNEHYINYPNDTLEKFKEVIRKSFHRGPLTLYPASVCMIKGKIICSLGDVIKENRGKRRNLNKLLQQILICDYPSVLPRWEDLTDEEQRELTGRALVRHEKKKKDYPEIMPTVIEIAIDIMDADGKSLKFYVTKNNDISAKLYSKILIKLPTKFKGSLGEDRLRSWLKKDLRSGKLKKLIEEEREKKR